VEQFISVDYNELKLNLGIYSAVILFQKKDKSKRVMLCTRNYNTVKDLFAVKMEGALIGHDKRHTQKTNTLAVIDLAVGEARAVTVNKILGIVWCGILNSANCEDAFAYYNQCSQYIESQENAEKLAREQELAAKLSSLASGDAIDKMSREELEELQQQINALASK
jgi:hypothetical protein